MKGEGNRYCCSDQCHKTTMHKWSKDDQCLVCQVCGAKKTVHGSGKFHPAPEAGLYMTTRTNYGR